MIPYSEVRPFHVICRGWLDYPSVRGDVEKRLRREDCVREITLGTNGIQLREC